MNQCILFLLKCNSDSSQDFNIKYQWLLYWLCWLKLWLLITIFYIHVRVQSMGQKRDFPLSVTQTESKKNIWLKFCFKSSKFTTFKCVLCSSRSHSFHWQLQTNLPDLTENLLHPSAETLKEKIKKHTPNPVSCSKKLFLTKITLFSGA